MEVLCCSLFCLMCIAAVDIATVKGEQSSGDTELYITEDN